MRLALIRDRIEQACPQLKQVLLALNGAKPSSFPAAYVFPSTERAAPNAVVSTHIQQVNASFSVEIMVKQAAQAASGGPAQEALEDVRDEIKQALKGWSPQPEYAPLDFVAGRLIDFTAGLVVWRDDYATEFYEGVSL